MISTTLKKIQDKLGLVGEENMSGMIHGIVEKNREIIFTKYFTMLESGISPEQIIIEMIEFFRNILLLKSNFADKKFLRFDSSFYDKKLLDSFSFEDIENILEVLFKTYENSKSSIDIQRYGYDIDDDPVKPVLQVFAGDQVGGDDAGPGGE